jgi:hypothetical protein
MKIRKIFVSSMIGVLLSGQISTVSLALEAPNPEPSSQPIVAVEPAPPAPATNAPVGDTPPTTVDSNGSSSSPAATPVTGTPTNPPADVTNTPKDTPGADGTTTGPQGPTGVDPKQTGPQTPTGVGSDKPVDGATTAGPDQPTGKKPEWVFNTITGKWETADLGSFTWYSKSGYWLSLKYVYDTRMGWYKIVPPVDSSYDTKPSYYVTAPEVVHTPVGDFVKGSPEYELAKSLGIIVDPAIVLTGPGSVNLANVNNSSHALVDFTNIVKLANVLNSASTSGNASADGNTIGGNATSGSAVVMANMVNLLNSVWNLSGGAVVTFVRNIFGDFFGDITLTMPGIVPSGSSASGGSATTNTTGPGSTNVSALNSNSDLTVNASNKGTIDNTINLNATSGNASANGNTYGGNATTGDARIALNLINIINSALSAGGGFVGILNVYGNLNGDILFGKDFVNQVVSAGSGQPTSVGNTNTGPGSKNSAASNSSDSLNLTANNHTTINNDINTRVVSGSASASNNNTAGNATSGTADTHSSVADLSNQNVNGTNAVLVIVNVMGHWLGGIMSLPGNITSALLGSADTTSTNTLTGPNSSNVSAVNTSNSEKYTLNNDMAINNHVNLNASSGNATVDGNTVAGNAKSGDSSVLSSVANISNTALNLKRWFGILIINVFGDWTGALGKNTVAGDAPLAVVPQVQQQTGTGQVTIVRSNIASSNVTPGLGTGTTTAVSASPSVGTAKVLGTAHNFTATQAAASHATAFMFMIAAGILMLAAVLAAAERRTRLRA